MTLHSCLFVAVDPHLSTATPPRIGGGLMLFCAALAAGAYFLGQAAKIRRAAAPLPPLPPLRGLRHGFVLGKSRGKPWKTLQIPCIVASPDVTVCLVWTGSRVTNVTRKPWNHPRWSHHVTVPWLLEWHAFTGSLSDFHGWCQRTVCIQAGVTFLVSSLFVFCPEIVLKFGPEGVVALQ